MAPVSNARQIFSEIPTGASALFLRLLLNRPLTTRTPPAILRRSHSWEDPHPRYLRNNRLGRRPAEWRCSGKDFGCFGGSVSEGQVERGARQGICRMLSFALLHYVLADLMVYTCL